MIRTTPDHMATEMTPELREMITLQGAIKIRMMQRGVTEPNAHMLANDIVQMMMKSKITAEEYRKIYNNLATL